MSKISLKEAKQYLRVDYNMDDDMILSLIDSAYALVKDVLRADDEKFEELLDVSYSQIKIAVLYALAYMYEHREEASYLNLTLDLRAMLNGVRQGKF